MASMVDILRDIVTTLGGTYSASDDTVSELLARIDAAYKAGGGGGSSLPAVTSDDNGNILRVVNGEWNKAGYPLYKVPVTVTENDGVYSASTDASYQDAITQASQQSTFLYARVEGLVASRICIIPITGIDTAAAAMEFSTVLNILAVGPAFVRINWLYNGDMSISVTPLETTT